MATPATLHALLRELVDYAGLFPPAGLLMEQAVRNYAQYRSSGEAWALGRFVTSVARMSEFASAFAELPAQHGAWRITALLGDDLKADLATIAAFNDRHRERVTIDAVEIKTASGAEITRLAESLPTGSITAYCEVPIATPVPLLALIRNAGMRAKIRTGGLIADAFPATQHIADFLCACAAEQVAFKATAGLHHPLRCDRPLTYEPNASTAVMHGFLNVFLAATLARLGENNDLVREMLELADPGELKFGEAALEWRGLTISLEDIAQTRANFAISFGSCSFEEPISDLQELHLL